MKPGDERFDAKPLSSSRTSVTTSRRKSSSGSTGPRGLGRKALQEIGAQMQQAREKAPASQSPALQKKTVDAIIA